MWHQFYEVQYWDTVYSKSSSDCYVYLFKLYSKSWPDTPIPTNNIFNIYEDIVVLLITK